MEEEATESGMWRGRDRKRDIAVEGTESETWRRRIGEEAVATKCEKVRRNAQQMRAPPMRRLDCDATSRLKAHRWDRGIVPDRLIEEGENRRRQMFILSNSMA